MELEAPDYVVLVVADVERTLAFYTEVLGPRARSSLGAVRAAGARTRVALFEREAMARTLGVAEPFVTPRPALGPADGLRP